jgi:hypothetical protein
VTPDRPPAGRRALSEAGERLFADLSRGGAPPSGDAPAPSAAPESAVTGPTSGRWYSGRAQSRALGTTVVVHLRDSVPTGVVIDARFQCIGCPHTLATLEWLMREACGQPLARPQVGGPREWAQALGVPAMKLGRLLLVEDAWQIALERARGGQAP